MTVQEQSEDTAAMWQDLGRRLSERVKAAPGVIYFIQCGDFPIVKVGYTHSPCIAKRFTSLQTSSPFKLKTLLEVEGWLEQELDLHSRFRKLRIRGEWYRLEGELLEFIQAHPKRPKPKKRR